MRFFLKNSAIVVGIGCTIFILLWILRDYTFIGDVEDESIDIFQRFTAEVKIPHPSIPPFLFVEIDRQLYHDLDYPLVIPRTALANAGRRIIEAEPRILIIDIDLGWTAPHEQNVAFLSFLQEVATTDIPVLLVRNDVAASNDKLAPIFRSTLFDKVVATANNLHWGISKVSVSADGIARRAQLYQAGCYKNNPVVYPSVSLLTFALLSSSSSDSGVSQLVNLQEAALPCSTLNKNKTRKSFFSKSVKLKIGQSTLVVSDDYKDHRIFYTMKWPAKNPPKVKLDGAPVDVAETISALHLFNHPELVSGQSFTNRVVVIGSSAPDARDNHMVPLGGMMPGSMIIVNDIRSLMENGFIESRGFWHALGYVALLSFTTFLIWLFFKDFLRQQPRLGWLLFQITAFVIWLPMIILFSLPALAFVLILAQYSIIIVLQFLRYGETRTINTVQNGGHR